jgi:hypothetical protein
MYIGHDPSSTTSTAEYNVAVGLTAMKSIEGGDLNTAVGIDAMYYTTSGGKNTAIGWRALRLNTSGSYNDASGYQSLTFNTSGDKNTASGYRALYKNTTAHYNTAMGYQALNDANRTADTDGYNVALGYNAGNTGTNDITTGNKNTLLGASTAASAAAGTNQTVIGYGASGKGDNTVTIGNGDITAWSAADDGEVDLGSSSVEFKDLYVDGVAYTDALGFGTVAMTLPTADGSANQVLQTDGSNTLSWANSSSVSDLDGLSDAKYGGDHFIGSLILGHETTGTLNNALHNTAVGYAALDAITSGDYNTALGSTVLSSNTSGGQNTGIGYHALNDLNTGSYNVAVGAAAGDLITSGTYNTIIGKDSDPSANDGTNQTVIGYGASGQANNSVTLGNADVTAVYMAQDQGATVYAAGVDITGSTGLILENDETITNSTDGTIVIDGKADFNDNAITGYGADLQTESGTTKTLAAADNGTIIVCSSSSAITITVPASLPSGFNCMIIQSGSGQVSLSASSTTLNNRNGSKTAGQYAILTLVHLGSNVFVVSGDTTS